ncbi:MAG: FkbM family methyltransferase [Magnetococcales bacterium]|nr:FkbM family methyltransferase [Magnetococcales bacterium]
MNINNILIKSLARSLYPIGNVRTVVRGPGRGLKFIVTRGNGVTYAWFMYSHWIQFLQQKISLGSVIYDVGGNTGHVAMLFSKITGKDGCVYSFEPSARPRNIFHENLILNNSIGNVNIIDQALTDTEGEKQFIIPNGKDTEGSLQHATHNHLVTNKLEQFTVYSTTLDLFTQSHPVPHFIKIDVEGGAGSVLSGAERLLSTAAPAIYIEFHNETEKNAVAQMLLKHRYKVFSLFGKEIFYLMDRWHSAVYCTRR